MAELEFRKDKKNREHKPIPETKAAKPKRRYKLDEDESIKEEVTSKKKKVGRPRTSKLTAIARVTDNTLDKLNSLKETLSLYSQDEVISRALDMYISNLKEEDRRVYDIILGVQMRKRKQIYDLRFLCPQGFRLSA